MCCIIRRRSANKAHRQSPYPDCRGSHSSTRRLLGVRGGHVPEKWPAHDLEQIAVEGWHETIGRRARGGRRASATWMYVIEVGALPHNLDELRVAMSTCRQLRFVWCQIAGVKVRNLVLGWKWPEWTKIPTSALRLLASRIAASNTFPALPTLVSNIGPSIP
jgi:hypothetical protein